MQSKHYLYISLFMVILACGYLVYLFSTNKPALAEETHDVQMQLNVLEYMSFDITAGDNFDFGDLTPGTPITAPATGTICSITTNASNGYTLAISDGSGTDSALEHDTDASTHVPDYAGTIATPTTWTGTGLGITMYAADNSRDIGKWCADADCSTYNDANNKYTAAPADDGDGIVHTVTGYRSGADTSSWAFQVDVPNDQKTGAYSAGPGDFLFTAIPVSS